MFINFKSILLVTIISIFSLTTAGFNSKHIPNSKFNVINQQRHFRDMVENDPIYQWSPPSQRLSFTKNEHYFIFTLLFLSIVVPVDAEVPSENKKELPYPFSIRSCEVSNDIETIDLTNGNYFVSPNNMIKLMVHPGLVSLHNPIIKSPNKPERFSTYEIDSSYESASAIDRFCSDLTWKHIEKTYFNSVERPIVLLLSTSRERFKNNVLHIANTFRTGSFEKGEFRGPEGTMYITKVGRFPFLIKSEWREYTAINNPELLSSLETLEAIANDLPAYASREPQLERFVPRLRELAQKDFDIRMRSAIELLIKSNKLSDNAFINYFIEIPKNYSPQELVQAFGNVRKQALKLIGQGKIIEAAAYLHMRIVEIHPAFDANGRTARALLNVALMSFGIDPVVFPSAEEYNEAVQNSCKKDYRIFARYLRQVIETQKDNRSIFDHLIDTMKVCKEGCQDLLNRIIESLK